MTDNDLLMQWVEQRDPEAFREVVNRHAAMVCATCRRIVRDAAEAEDVTQECFEALAKAGTRPGAYLGAWLHRVATNRSLQSLRTVARRRARESTYAEAESTDESTEWQEAYAHIDQALNELPEHLRAPLVLYYLENQTQEAIAETLGVARTTVSYRIGQGLDRVRKSLRKRGVTLTAGAIAALGVSASSTALPPTLAASLGRLAIAGTELLPAAPGGTGLFGGLLSLKGALTLSMVVVLGVVAYEAFQYTKPAPAQQTAQQSPPQPTAQPAREGVSPSILGPGASPSTAIQPIHAPPPAPGKVNVVGDLLMEGTNTPCRGTVVVFRSGTTGQELHAGTDDAGRFTLRDCEPGAFQVFLDDDIRVLKDAPVALDVAAGKPDIQLHLVVDAGASVSGRIFNKETGEGIPGTGVFVAPVTGDGTRVSASSENSVKTDRNGQYRFEGLRLGKYRIFLDPEITAEDANGNILYRLEIPGSTPNSDIVVTGRQQFENIDFPVLLGGALISGTVRDSQGRPACGARVVATSAAERQNTETQKDGTFTIRGLPATNECYAFARLDTEASEIMGPLTLPEGGLDGVQLHLRPGGIIRGTLTDSQGAPLVANMLNARTSYRFGLGTAAASTDKDGAFQFNALAEGTYEITLVQQSRDVFVPNTTLAKIKVKWAQTTDNVVLVYGGSPTAKGPLQISGRVTDAAGQPVPGAGIDARIMEEGISGTSTNQAWTDGDGNYQVDGLEKRAYVITARSSVYSTSRIASVEGGSTKIDFVLQSRVTIAGRVVRAEDGRPVTQFEISAPGARPVQIADADGRFELPNIDAADYCRVTVRAPGYAEWKEDIDLKQGSGARQLVVTMNRASGLSGRVLNSEGQPISGARIFVTKGINSVDLNQESAVAARSDENGMFLIDSLPAGNGFVLASHTEYATGSAPYRPGISNVDVVLPYGGAVDGIVTSGGTPAANAEVVLSRSFILGKEYASPLSTKTGTDGTFHFEQAPPGKVIVNVVFDKDVKDPFAMRSIFRHITIESGKTVSVALDLPAATAEIEGQVRMGGRPAATVMVLFNFTKDGVESPYMAQVDENGFFKFDAVPAGSGTLRAGVPTGNAGSARVVVISVETVAGQVTRQDIDIIDSGVIVADVKGVTPSPQTIVSINVFPSDVPVHNPDALWDLQVMAKALASAVVKTDGPVRLEMLPPGAYNVTALMTDLGRGNMRSVAMATAVVTVENGVEAPVELVLQPIQE